MLIMLFIVATLIRSSPTLVDLSHSKAFRRATFTVGTGGCLFRDIECSASELKRPS